MDWWTQYNTKKIKREVFLYENIRKSSWQFDTIGYRIFIIHISILCSIEKINVAGDIAKAYKVDKTAKDEVKDVTEATVNVETADASGKVDDANAKVVSIGQYRAGW